MQVKNRLLDDLARVASDAMGVASGMREEVESLMRQRLARVLDDMELVSREEFEAVKEMAAKARAEQEVLIARLAKLEAKLAAGTARAPAKRAKRAGGKKKN